MKAIGEVKPTEPTGLRCPRCGCGHLPVVYTRPRRGFILRVRRCRHCGRRIATRESGTIVTDL